MYELRRRWEPVLLLEDDISDKDVVMDLEEDTEDPLSFPCFASRSLKGNFAAMKRRFGFETLSFRLESLNVTNSCSLKGKRTSKRQWGGPEAPVDYYEPQLFARVRPLSFRSFFSGNPEATFWAAFQHNLWEREQSVNQIVGAAVLLSCCAKTLSLRNHWNEISSYHLVLGCRGVVCVELKRVT